MLDAKSIEFDLGDTALVDDITAKFLLENGIADKVDSVFVRQLREYATYFNDGYRQELQFEDEAKVIKQDTITLIEANRKALEQVTYRADEIGKLQLDREGFGREAAAIAGVLTKVEAQYASTRSRLSQLFRTNAQLAAQIRTLQTQAAESIRRSEDSASGQPATPTDSEVVSAP